MKTFALRIAIVLALAGLPATGAAQGYPPYLLFQPNPAGGTGNYLAPGAAPTANGPFLHWDLREMPGAQVPWTASGALARPRTSRRSSARSPAHGPRGRT
jgi:hypothetical protein